MCSQFGYSKQAYYKQLQQLESKADEEAVVVGLIRKQREVWKRGSGRNLHQSLQKEMKRRSIKMGRDKFFDVLRRNALLVKPKRLRARTTSSYHHFNKYPNLIAESVAVRPNEIWVSDITYMWLKKQDRFCYLSLITDLYSRKIVGYCVHEDLSVSGSLEALQMALGQRRDKTKPLIHHSDRGVQYCCHAYVQRLRRNKVRISMTERGDPLENAVAERINRTIKEEFTEDREINFADMRSAKREVKKFVAFYNNRRPHRSIDWHTPNEAHRLSGQLRRRWKNYYRRSTEGEILGRHTAPK
jgi:putative transposase